MKNWYVCGMDSDGFWLVVNVSQSASGDGLVASFGRSNALGGHQCGKTQANALAERLNSNLD